jgi:hypothetical protein
VKRKILASVAVVGAAVGLLQASHAVAGTRSMTFRSGIARVAFVSQAGLVRSRPFVAVSDGRPGLRADPVPIALRNTGTITLDLEVWVMLRPGDGGLGDGLLGIVRARDGAVIYRGSLAGLRFRLVDLRPDETRTCDLGIRWPGGLDGNRLQGRNVAFELRATAVAAST